MREDIASIRKEYIQSELDEASVSLNPFDQFEKWFQEALKSDIIEPTAMTLSSVDSNLQPFQRTVLLKEYDQTGFVFYTNYESRKANHLKQNPRVSILFPWYALERQVLVTGEVQKVSRQASLAYFRSRPSSSQLGAWVSNQSEVIESRNTLEKKFEEIKEKFKDGEIPLPDHWGGYRIIPSSFEFWQGRSSRLHDRLFFEKSEKDWKISRLAP